MGSWIDVSFEGPFTGPLCLDWQPALLMLLLVMYRRSAPPMSFRTVDPYARCFASCGLSSQLLAHSRHICQFYVLQTYTLERPPVTCFESCLWHLNYLTCFCGLLAPLSTSVCVQETLTHAVKRSSLCYIVHATSCKPVNKLISTH